MSFWKVPRRDPEDETHRRSKAGGRIPWVRELADLGSQVGRVQGGTSWRTLSSLTSHLPSL